MNEKQKMYVFKYLIYFFNDTYVYLIQDWFVAMSKVNLNRFSHESRQLIKNPARLICYFVLGIFLV